VLEEARARLPDELQGLEARQHGSLIKFFADDPAGLLPKSPEQGQEVRLKLR
jgi:hypothetical protein